MGEPYIGKQCDTLNKMAIASLFRDNIEEAEEYWTKSLDLYPNHFDTLVNYEMFRWRYAFVSDEELLSTLEESVFKNKHKGHSLQGIISIALGDKKKGIQILEAFNNKKVEASLVSYDDPSENLRRKRAREHAQEVYQEVSLKQDDFFQNMEI